jgi:hypothetical protein
VKAHPSPARLEYLSNRLQVKALARNFRRSSLSQGPDATGLTNEDRRAMAEDDVSQELDLDLVARVQRGDSAAFDLLVRKYQHRSAALIGRYVHDWSEVQDVAQDTFIRAYKAIGAFRGDAQFYTWLHRIAVNTAKNHLVATTASRRPTTSRSRMPSSSSPACACATTTRPNAN